MRAQTIVAASGLRHKMKKHDSHSTHEAAMTPSAQSASANGNADVVLARCSKIPELEWSGSPKDVDVVISYRSRINEGDDVDNGLWLCKGLAHALRDADIKPFYGEYLGFRSILLFTLLW